MKKNRFMSLFLVLALLMQVIPCITFNTAAASNRPVMDSDNAAMFIGFFTNNGKLTENEIKSSDAYKILTNTYSGDDEDAKILALKLIKEINTAEMANQASINKDFYTGEIISYLEKHVPSSESIGLSEEIINEYKNHYSKILVDAMKDIVDSLFSEATSCFQVSDLYDLYGSATGTVNKAKKIVDYTMASIEGICLIYENEYAGRYGYFQSYLNNRSGYSSPNDEIFQTIMDYNRLAYSDSNWLSGFLNVFSFITNKDSFTNHFDLMDSWAEFTYQLGVYIEENNNNSSSGGASESTEFEVSSISFAVSDYSLFMNYSLTNPAMAFPTNATNRNITYSSSDSSIATVDSSGKITPVKSGTVKIYASTANGITNSCTITILPFRATEINNGYEIAKYVGTQSQVIIPRSAQGKSITSIGASAFYCCSSLTNITIPNSVTSIGQEAFAGCGLSSVTIPNSVTSIGARAFSWCSSLTSVTIPNSVTSIGDSAFYDCSSLTSVTIPNGVTSIGDYAFWGCSNLTSVTIADSVKSIGNGPFSNCGSLTAIIIDADNQTYSSIDGVLFDKDKTRILCCPGGKSGEYVIPNSVTSIGRAAFNGCRSLTSIAIPNSVTWLGASVFANCSSLTSVAMSNSVTSIGNGTFSGCSSLTSVTIPDKVTSIGDSAFFGCRSLTSVTIPDSVTSIGSFAFRGCNSLTSIIIPHSVTSIGIDAFFECKSLTSITIPNSVTSIGYDAFFGCYELKYVFYGGSESDWKNISIGSNNSYPTNSCIHYNSTDHSYNSKWKLDVTPTDSAAGQISRHCEYCDSVTDVQELPYLKISGATLTLYDDISVNYMVSKDLFEGTAYTNPYMVFEFNGKKTKVTNYTISGNYYCFSFANVAPDKMNDTIKSTLYASVGDTLLSSDTREYSIAEYCYSMLNYYSTDAYANLRTLLVDLLNYGAYTQNYTGHNTENLVNANLTDEQKAWASGDIETFTDALNTKYATVDNPTVKWRGAELELNSAITMKFVIQTDSIEGLTVKITDDNGHSWTVKSSTFKKYADGYHYVYFNGLDASQMSDNIYLTVYSGDTIVSNTVRYSIESYASAMKDSTNDKLSTLVHSMMKYGNSAKQYKNKGVN